MRMNVLAVVVVSLLLSPSFANEATHDENGENVGIPNEELSKELIAATTNALVDLVCGCRDANSENDDTKTKPFISLSRPDLPTDCDDVFNMGFKESGRYKIYPFHLAESNGPIEVWCDMKTEGGGWTVIQSRQDGSVDFNRGWEDYKQGFGILSGEFWLGNENIHDITNQREYELRVETKRYDGRLHNYHLDYFRIAEESRKYTLLTKTYTGNQDFCINPLGMEDKSIKDDQITASEQYSHGTYLAKNARLNLAGGSWLPKSAKPVDPWIQVNFGVPKLISGLITQGRYNGDGYVTKFEVKYGNDDKTLKSVMDMDGASVMVFNGNSDRHTPVTNYFASPVKASVIRILPTSWSTTHFGLRFELLGCDGNVLAYQNNQPFSTKDTDNDAVEDVNCALESRSGWWYKTCENFDLNVRYLEGAGVTTRGIIWEDFKGQEFSLKSTEMKIRPISSAANE